MTISAAQPSTSTSLEFKTSFTSSYDIVERLYNQDKCNGLDNDTIRKDIEIVLVGVIKSRQLRNILPLELNRKYTYANSAMITKLRRQPQLATDSINKVIHTPTQAQSAIQFRQQFTNSSTNNQMQTDQDELEEINRPVDDSII